MSKWIAVVGLGLIGGSMAMALQGFEEYEVVGVDVSQPTLRFAMEHHVADRIRWPCWSAWQTTSAAVTW